MPQKKANKIIVKILGYAAYTEILYNGRTMTGGEIEKDVKNGLLFSLDTFINDGKLPTGNLYPLELRDLPYNRAEIVEWATKPKGENNILV